MCVRIQKAAGDAAKVWRECVGGAWPSFLCVCVFVVILLSESHAEMSKKGLKEENNHSFRRKIFVV